MAVWCGPRRGYGKRRKDGKPILMMMAIPPSLVAVGAFPSDHDSPPGLMVP